MHRSSALARIITTLVTLLAVPIALLALSAGGAPLMEAVIRREPLEVVAATSLPLSLAWIALGVVLLAGVALLGIWSSAGLLASGVYAVVCTLAILAPSLTARTAISLSDPLPGQLGRYGVWGLSYGGPALVMLTLSAMGAVLALTRRRPVRSLPLAVVGTVLSPVLLLVGMMLLVGGVAAGTSAQVQAGFTPLQFAPGAGVVVGAVMILVGVALCAVAPYALLVPGTVAPLLTALFLTPLPFSLGGPGTIAGLPRLDALSSLQALLVLGAGPALAALFLTFTMTLAVVRRRSRNTPPPPGKP